MPEGDFAPGQVLIGRYRIVSLVGEGGMGQVYRADDLVLGQPVAVKFLPAHVAAHEDGLELFRAEVRHAREVSHPNVARVHDIGEVDGRHFLTMEFVDGEDLAGLVRRIGRLPREKASQIAQQICSALAEAHRKGVLHRDLKPANVMLDGEGRVRLTDFGVAVAAKASADAPLAGTPSYMAPEQLSGVPASVQSEIYSLGLLLYELYTGARALRGRTLDELRREHEEGGPRPPSSQLADIDPGVESVLNRCLARDPNERPSSVLAVARALPGGDPLAAALAAGETPAPDVVAEARTQGALAPRTALALLLGAALVLLAGTFVRDRYAERTGVSYGKPPEVLRERARRLATELTGATFAHEIHWYMADGDVAVALRERDAAGGPSGLPAWSRLVHHSRFGPEPLRSNGLHYSATDPAPLPGSAHVVLDANGNLIAWSHRGTVEADPAGFPHASLEGGVDWTGLLAETGFAPDALEATEPRRVPEMFVTEQRAWTRTANGSQSLRIEAAAFRGHPVLLEILHGDRPLGLDAVPPTLIPEELAVFVLALTVLGACLAWHNVRHRRADVRGALKVGGFAFATHVILGFSFDMPDDFIAYGSQLYSNLGYPLHVAFRVTVFYLALEPFARRRWPQTLVSWNRLLKGRLRDASVGREILLGLVGSQAALVLMSLVGVASDAFGLELEPPPLPRFGFEGPFATLAGVLHSAGDAVMFSGTFVLLLVLLRSVVRLPWIANSVFLVLVAIVPIPVTARIVLLAYTVILLVLLTRVGFLSVVSMWFVISVTGTLPLTLRPGDWTFTLSLVALTSLAAVGIWAYRTAAGGRSLLEAG